MHLPQAQLLVLPRLLHALPSLFSGSVHGTAFHPCAQARDLAVIPDDPLSFTPASDSSRPLLLCFPSLRTLPSCSSAPLSAGIFFYSHTHSLLCCGFSPTYKSLTSDSQHNLPTDPDPGCLCSCPDCHPSSPPGSQLPAPSAPAASDRCQFLKYDK